MDTANSAQELSNLIGDYLAKYSNMSINALAKRAGIGATTIRNILNNQSKDPDLNTIIKLVKTISKEDDVNKIAQSFDGAIGNKLRNAFSHNDEYQLISGKKADLFGEPDYF